LFSLVKKRKEIILISDRVSPTAVVKIGSGSADSIGQAISAS
jgi:hypothetical protein